MPETQERNKTVLILGAGASEPYGFPVGSKLVTMIWQNFSGYVEGANKEVAKGVRSLDHVRNFTEELRYSGLTSIDAFLERREDFRDIGKLAIARMLLPQEDWLSLFQPRKGHWYEHLHNWLAPKKVEDFPRRKAAIITYNYDRSLEAYLTRALANSFGVPMKEASQYVDALPIVHMHGHLGRPSWQDGDDSPTEYGNPANYQEWEELRKSARGINIIYEKQVEESDALKRAWALLKQAKTVMFMGFGYDEVNLDRLRLAENVHKDTQIAGSAYGMTGVQREITHGILRNLSGRRTAPYFIELQIEDCMGLIKNTTWMQM